jgi:hypothetical protein
MKEMNGDAGELPLDPQQSPYPHFGLRWFDAVPVTSTARRHVMARLVD